MRITFVKSITGMLTFVAFLSFLSVEQLNSQEREYNYAFHRLTESEGLSDGVNAWVYKDSYGFIWISSMDGLNRFDGLNVKTYKPNPSDPNSLSDNIVTSTFYEDGNGDLWFTTYGGINVYIRRYDRFRTIKLKNEKGEWIEEDYFAFHMDTSGHLWVKTGVLDAGTLHWYDINSDKDSILCPLQGQRLSVVDHDTQNELIFSMRFIDRSGLNITALDTTHKFHGLTFFRDHTNQHLPVANIYGMVTSEYPLLWMASNIGLIEFNLNTQRFALHDSFKGDPTGTIRSVVRYQNLLLAASENHGLLNFDINSRKFESQLVPDINNKYSIRRKEISNINIDKNDCVWLSYYDNGVREGLDYSNLKKYRFPNYSFISNNSSQVYELSTTTSGDVFVARDNKALLVNDSLDIESQWIFEKDIRLIRTDNSDRLWVVFQKDTEGNFEIVRSSQEANAWEPMGASDQVIDDLLMTSTGKVLLATRKGVFELDINSKKISSSDSYEQLSNQRIYHIVEGMNDNLFFSTQFDRVYIYNLKSPGSGPWAEFTGVGYCSSFYPWPDKKKAWVSSSMGIGEIDLESNTFDFISGPDKTLTQQKYFNVLVHNDQCWLKTERGLIKFNYKDSTLSSYERVDGVVSVIGDRAPALKDGSGRIWISGLSGINIFHPDSIKPISPPPTPQIVEINVNDGPYKTDYSHGILDTLNLNYNQNTVSIEFVPCQIGDPKNIKFQYRLVGYDDNWVASRASGFARYFSLPAGDYTFEARTGNSDGQWSVEPASIKMVIHPPFWATTWAYFIYGSSFFGLLWYWRRSEKKKQAQKLELERRKVAQEKRVNEELRKVDRLKDQFLANTSHELRTPLNGIIGLAESLIEGATGQLPDKTRSNLAMIASSGKRLSNLVNDILDFSRMKSNDLRLEMKAVDLCSAVDIVMTLLNPLRKNRSVKMINRVSKDLPRTKADEDRLQQILYNLIGNAIKFTREGEIVVTAEVRNEKIELCVSDTGIGIPDSELENIFRSFEQVDGSEIREFGGTGLGLSVTRQLIELHSGKIWVESKVGEGSKFFFTLDIAGKELEVSTPEKTEIEEQVLSLVTDDLEGLIVPGSLVAEDETENCILIVDDEPVNRQVLENHLSNAGYSSIVARDGEEALNIVQKQKVGLILLDIMMPGLSGFQVCEAIRRTHPAISLPIIMLTAKNRVSDLVEGFTSGANDYLTKPFSQDELLARIKTHLSLRKIYSATGKFVPFAFLNAIGHEQISNVRLGDHSLVEVSVLFADIRDFTRLSESMSPTENFNFVNDFVGRMGPVIQKHRGFVNQYLGDGIMAIFPHSSTHAIAASIEMMESLRDFNRELLDSGKEAIRIGIGLHTGPLIMGIIGDENRSDPATIADTVNTSSRLEGLTKYYRANIIVSEESLHAHDKEEKNLFRFLGKVKLKGKARVIGIYECISGDPPDIVRNKLAGHSQYRAAMTYYQKGKLEESRKIFRQLLEAEPRDTVVSFFLEKINSLIDGGMPPDWEAIEVMTQK